MASSQHQYATIPHDYAALTPSPTLPELPQLSLSAAFEDLTNTLFRDDAPTRPKQSVNNVLKSLTGSLNSTPSYELVEEDDYEHSQITPRHSKTMAEVSSIVRPTNPNEDAPARTASISRHLPLHNPTPDLQSLQGAYLKNVQALEDSAERISLASSMEEELQKIKLDMRRTESLSRSTQHISGVSGKQVLPPVASNSIISVNAAARSGGYSPGAFVTSPVGSVRSQRRPSQRKARLSRASLPEPEQEGRPLESAMVHSPPSHAMQPRQSSESQRSLSQSSFSDRPATSASNDTYRQAQNLFADFDGTHFAPVNHPSGLRRISLHHPPLARDSRVFKEAQPDQPMVYYPAPVPVMLNLPKRLSRGDWAQHVKKRSQVLNNISAENRKSAVWLANAEIDAEFEEEKPKRKSQIPSQLRASAFFDAAGAKTDIQLQRGSAVLTLDSILDAAAHAPVTAFTDHPIVGHLGSEVYGSEARHRKKSSEHKHKKQKSSLSNMLAKRKSSESLSGGRRLSRILDGEVEIPDDDPERAAERSIAPDDDELMDGGEDDASEEKEGDDSSEEQDDDDRESKHQLGFLGAPTTLLAELQMRKAQQKLRNRTAANAFPTGMHSTLLELDAVAQLQQKSRKQKHVALAWEDQEMIEQANLEDEDVPLGVLFPEKERQHHQNLTRPLGLMEKKELEENEPLSSRRARLRGEEYRPFPQVSQPPVVQEEPAPALKLSGLDAQDEDEDGEETLAQRRKRMQEKQNQSQGFVNDIASQLGLDPEQIGGSKTPEAAEPEQEETLGQRRKRLQAEADRKGHPLKPKTSMGDLLRANPVGSRNDERQVSAESKVSLLMNRRDPGASLVDHIQAQQPNSKAIPTPPLAENNPSSYFPKELPLARGLQMNYGQFPGMQMPQMQAMQSMPNLHMMNGHAGMGMSNFGMQQYPYNQNFNMSNMNMGMNNMTYNPMNMGMSMGMGTGAIQMPVGGHHNPAPAYDAIGMGPPLNPQQRANIDRWRQGIA